MDYIELSFFKVQPDVAKGVLMEFSSGGMFYFFLLLFWIIFLFLFYMLVL